MARNFWPIHKRSKDEELILRFLAFFYDADNYLSPMRLFLNNFMGKNRNLGLVTHKAARDLFTSTLYPIYEALGDRAFRLTKSINAAIFDSLMVAVAKNDVSGSKQIKKAYSRLLSSEDYLTSVAKATANPKNVENRMRLADQAVRASL